MFIKSFLKCIHCSETVTNKTFPLCFFCHKTLHIAHQLNQSANTQTPGSSHHSLQSLSSIFRGFEEAFLILKTWKFKGGPYFDQKVLIWNQTIDKHFKQVQPKTIIPVPSPPENIWKRQHHPTQKISHWIQKKIKTSSIVNALKIMPKSQQNPNQSQKNLFERKRNNYRFYIDSTEKLLEPILIVDDFITSGETLKGASEALHLLGQQEIHGFCLLIRAPNNEKPNPVQFQ